MKRRTQLKLKIALLAFCIASVSVCCKKKEKGDPAAEEPAATFDKQAMLLNYADNLILPAYTAFRISLDSLISAYDGFKDSGSLSDFQACKQKFTVAYLKYQRISIFGFGPGEDANIRVNFNIFPADTQKIKANITGGSYNLSLASTIDAKGFPAIDYLFYGHQSTELRQKELLNSENNRKKYVSDVLNDMSIKINAVVASWGSYRNVFVSSLGTDVGSSIGFMINQINYELDYLKNAKIATPLGLRSGGTPLPGHCEAIYEGQSLKYALETLTTIENVYLGRSFTGNDGKGFDDYLDHLQIMHIDLPLNAAIKLQFQIAREKMNAITNPLPQQVFDNSATVNTAYKELVKLLVLLKTDMPSGLGVVITYQDGDGD